MWVRGDPVLRQLWLRNLRVCAGIVFPSGTGPGEVHHLEARGWTERLPGGPTESVADRGQQHPFPDDGFGLLTKQVVGEGESVPCVQRQAGAVAKNVPAGGGLRVGRGGAAGALPGVVVVVVRGAPLDGFGEHPAHALKAYVQIGPWGSVTVVRRRSVSWVKV